MDDAELAVSQSDRLMQTALAHATAAACELCGHDIPPARRAALPGARLCVACQEGLERGAR